MDLFICGNASDHKTWEKEVLHKHIENDGLKKEVFQWFIECLSELDEEEKKKFLLFTTGSVRLPPGGFQNLNPQMRVRDRRHYAG